MTDRIIHLFPDTNVFIQCHPLDQLDWSTWKDFDEIHLIVSRPVQSEIDNQKNKGSDRLGKKARATSSLFREIILGASDHKLVRHSGPIVKLFIKPELKVAAELADTLNYQERDDQLVGIAHAFRAAHASVDVRVLTHDTGPMATAKMIGLAVAPVPDKWLIPPENTDTERTIKTLETEVVRLRKAEPNFKIVCIDEQRNPIRALEITSIRYEQLSEEELAELMAKVTKLFPVESEFGPREPYELDVSTPGLKFLGIKQYFTPASENDIALYRDEKYPKWLSSCQAMLRSYHQSLQHRAGAPTFTFVAGNDGARPAKDALVTIEAKGNFKIMPPSHSEEDEKTTRDTPELPQPPSPPKGQWHQKFAGQSHLLDAIALMKNSLPSVAAPIGRDDALLHRYFSPPNLRRDPNQFYYKPNRIKAPGPTFSLECEQWRHGINPEFFSGEIHFDWSVEQIAGALTCKIHAENLSDPAAITVPVRITIRRVRPYKEAQDLIDVLVTRPRGLMIGSRS